MKVENADGPDDKCRYYEIPATPHTDIICPILPATSEIEKTGAKMPNLDPRLLENINDIPTEYYICGLLEKLHRWAVYDETPEIMEPLVRSGNDLVRDQYGNALGGLRTPYVDVPIASYVASNPEDPEGICGKMTYFTRNEVEEKYGSVEEYQKQIEEKVEQIFEYFSQVIHF